MLCKFDIMVNGGDKFYGTVHADIATKWKRLNGKIVEVCDNEDVKKKVLQRFPTLKNKQYLVLPYNSNRCYLDCIV